MRSRLNRTRCHVCHVALSRSGYQLLHFSAQRGWRTWYCLCRICAKVLLEVTAEVAKEYQ